MISFRAFRVNLEAQIHNLIIIIIQENMGVNASNLIKVHVVYKFMNY